MRNKPIQADQLIPTSATPPPEAGFYRVDRNTIGVVGELVQMNPATKSKTNITNRRNGINDKVLAAKYPMDSNTGPLACVVMGDSTGNSTEEWVYQTSLYLASKYPSHTHTNFIWNHTNQQYDQPATFAYGSAGAGHVDTGIAAQSWIMQIADSAATSPTGDIDVRAKICLNGSAPSADCPVAAKFGSAGNRSWRLTVAATTGLVTLGWSNDGTTLIDKLSTVALSGNQINLPVWVRATLDVDNGASGNTVKFYTSTDNVTWTQLGADVVTAGTTSIFNSTSTTQFIGRGAGSLTQQTRNISFYELEVYASLDGTSRIVDIDVGAMENTATTASATTFIDDVGNTVDVAKNASSGSFVGSYRFAMFNASTSSQTISYSYDATRYAKQFVSTPRMAIINYGHNEGSTVAYRTPYKTLTDKLLTSNPDICILATAQNKKVSPATNIIEHQIRNNQIAAFAASQGFILVDIFNLLVDTESDGLHPTPAGSITWQTEVCRVLGFAV